MSFHRRKSSVYDSLYAKGALAFLKGRSLAQAQSQFNGPGTFNQRDAIQDGYEEMRLDEVRRRARETFKQEAIAA
jgi:hypothetical protein